MDYLEFFKIRKFAGGGLSSLVDDAIARVTANNGKPVSEAYNKADMIAQQNGGWAAYLQQMEEESLADEQDRYENMFADETVAIKEDSSKAAINTALTGNPLGKTTETATKSGKFTNFSNFVSSLNNTSGSDANTAVSGIQNAIKAKNPMAGIGAVFNAGVDYADKALMGDKNFDTESQATDELVNGTTNALMSTGNPAAIGVAMAIKGLNFIDKSTGKTVPGFEVNVPNSGFGGVKESKSDQSFRLTQTGKMDKKFSMRNLQAEQALAATGLSEDIKFEQEARMNSVQNTLINNQIALAGGLSTDLLAAKRGAKLRQLKDYKKIRAERWVKKVVKAQDGAKLKNVEVSSEPNVIPEGDYHKNKHDLDLDNITKKGIPVIQVPDDSVETFTEIKQQEGDIVQSAEIERAEITFSKETTDFIEENRTKWKETNDDSILLEVGKRLVKEIMTNTNDNIDLISKMQEKLDNEKDKN